MGKPIKHQFQSESTQKTSYLKTQLFIVVGFISQFEQILMKYFSLAKTLVSFDHTFLSWFHQIFTATCYM